MRNNIVKVKMWNRTVGLLSWDVKRNRALFQFAEDFSRNGWDIAPLKASLHSPAMQRGFPLYGNPDKLYGGLPEFIADSLPDRWGNMVFQKWLEAKHISTSQINAVDRLTFIGKRAMGALEFEPAQVAEDASVDLQLQSLYELANLVFKERQITALSMRNNLILEDLYKVGTSAGGQRPKAIIAIDDRSGIIRSGQADLPPEFKHYILKFDTGSPKDFPFTRTEMAYYLMACDAGIDMMPSRLVEIDGRQHFLTQRFDRVNGVKMHTQTLAAMSELADSYEDLFVVGRKLQLSETAHEQQFRRMAFNVMAGNMDDHTKNFSFMMSPDGKWTITPAYDIVFSTDSDSPFYRYHEITLLGKRSHITRNDLLTFARQQGIKDAACILDNVEEAISHFKDYADATGISKEWTKKIWHTLQEVYR